jgi:hypothetical protein
VDEEPVAFAVSGRAPAPSDSLVDVRTPVVVSFSRHLDTAAVQGTLTLENGGRLVRGALRLEGDTALAFEPATPLEPGERWDVTLASSVRAVDGTALDTTLTWSFRTAGAPLAQPTAGRMVHLVGFLAHDSLRGRGSGSGDEARAAQAIARDLETSGLVPFQGSWVDIFNVQTHDNPPRSLQSRNVLGVVPGAGALADEWIVVGGHYDHLGFVEQDDGSLSIYHGADDNASGSALVMEVARRWSETLAEGGDTGPRRSVLFALWGAEERGLLGSCFFVGSGDLPPERITAVFNFDMVGRLGAASLRVPVAEPDSVWWGTLGDANRTDLALDPTPGCTGCSDHGCFLQQGVPVAWFYTRTHDDYHRPTDTADRIDYDGLARIGGLVMGTLWRLAAGAGVGSSG